MNASHPSSPSTGTPGAWLAALLLLAGCAPTDQPAGADTAPDEQAISHAGDDATWGIDACADTTASEGWKVGDISEDWQLDDQDGLPVSLHDFCARRVYVIFAAFW